MMSSTVCGLSQLWVQNKDVLKGLTQLKNILPGPADFLEQNPLTSSLT